MIPSIVIYTRHSSDCQYRDDETYRKCRCRKWLRWTYEGERKRVPAKSRSWAEAERKRREIEAQIEAAETHKPIEANQPVTVEQAISSFTAEKAQASRNTLTKYRLTLNRLLAFCTRKNLIFVREITLPHLSEYRATWGDTYDTVFGLRNEQSRLRAFFSYLQKARVIDFNPAKALSAIKVTDDDYKVDPFTEAEVKKIIAAVDKCEDITPYNRDRVRVLMQLQRWSGLSLVDAVCLRRDELKQTGQKFRIDTRRRKTGSRVGVPIPTWLGRELLRVKNGHPEFFFQTGEATSKSAVSNFDKWYRTIFTKAGVSGGSHRFRHFFAVSLLERGVDIRIVSKALGHKSLAITERHYAAWSQAQQKKMESEIARAWK